MIFIIFTRSRLEYVTQRLNVDVEVLLAEPYIKSECFLMETDTEYV